MDVRYPKRMKSLVALVRAEIAVEAVTAQALEQWLPQYLALLIDGKAPSVRTPKALTAAVTPDPSLSEQARPLWDALVASLVIPKLRDLWKTLASRTYSPYNEPMSSDFAQRASEFISKAPDRFFKLAEAIVSEGVRTGQSPEQIAQRLRDGLPEFVPAVAKNTGRFLGGDVYNAATIDAAKFLGPRIVKSWVSMHDLRVRPTHFAADADPKNDRIPLGAQFSVGGYYADHPRDPALPLDEVMNCRCFVDIESI